MSTESSIFLIKGAPADYGSYVDIDLYFYGLYIILQPFIGLGVRVFALETGVQSHIEL